MIATSGWLRNHLMPTHSFSWNYDVTLWHTIIIPELPVIYERKRRGWSN